jgi:hypothetical protein
MAPLHRRNPPPSPQPLLRGSPLQFPGLSLATTVPFAASGVCVSFRAGQAEISVRSGGIVNLVGIGGHGERPRWFKIGCGNGGISLGSASVLWLLAALRARGPRCGLPVWCGLGCLGQRPSKMGDETRRSHATRRDAIPARGLDRWCSAAARRAPESNGGRGRGMVCGWSWTTTRVGPNGSRWEVFY